MGKEANINMSEEEDLSICPRCQEEVPDEKIYSCEICDKICCHLCLPKHMWKHKKKRVDNSSKINFAGNNCNYMG